MGRVLWSSVGEPALEGKPLVASGMIGVLPPGCHHTPKGLTRSLVHKHSISVTGALGSCCWKMVFSGSSH